MIEKFKVVQQVEEYDCASACLATILLDYFSIETSIFELKPLIKNTESGTAFSDIYKGLRKIGLSAELFEAKKDIRTFEEVTFPLITQIKAKDSYHYILIFKKSKRSLIIGDPSENKSKKISIRKFEKIWIPYLISINVDKSSPKIANSSQTKKISIWKYIKSVKFKVLFMMVFSVVTYIIGIFLSNMFNVYFNLVIPQKASFLIPNFIIIYLSVFIVNQIIQLLNNLINNDVSKIFDEKLLIDYFNGILSKPRYAINEYGADELLTDVSNIPTIRAKILSTVVQIPIDILWLVVSLYILIKINLQLSIATIIMLLVLLYVTVICSSHFEKISTDYINNISKFNNYLIDHIENMASIRELGVTNLFIKKSITKYKQYLQKRNKILNFDAVVKNVRQTISSGFSIILFSIGSIDIVNGNLSTGSLLMFNSILGFTIDPLLDITGLQSLLIQGQVATYRVNSAMARFKFLSKSSKNIRNLNFENYNLKNIDFQLLSFSFNSKQKLLKNISFYIEEGSNVAITGENGSGKTTIGKLICKLLIRDSGNIKFNSLSIDDFPENVLDEKLLFVDANQKLINDSIFENINLKRDVPYVRINDVSKEIGLLQDLKKNGISLTTLVGSKGTKLSFGQIQMIKVLQATIIPRDIYVFDEITNGLDVEHENRVIDYLLRLKGIKIFLTHDKRLVDKCNQELHIKDGYIEEIK